ncbi:MAG: alternative ribosome rescue aminoacyl-tRNA hydrolase ArfB [Pseudomonadota bacterium]
MSSRWLDHVPPEAVTLRFVRSGGPGGQNVNKVATAVQLRVALDRTHLPTELKDRLRRQQSHLLAGDNVLQIQADRHRTQGRNRADAWERLGEALDRAAIAPRNRIATRPSNAARRKRRDAKKQRGALKRSRRPPAVD